MSGLIKRFFANESGAITVDWVVLTAALVLLGAAVAIPVGQASKAQSDGIASVVASQTVTGRY